MKKLFVSYAREDLEAVQSTVRELQSLGYDVWIDTNKIIGGKRWSAEIAKAIADCDFFLLFISSSSRKSKGVRAELDLAHKNERNIIPILLESVKIPIEWDYALAGLQWIDRAASNWMSQLLVALGETPSRPAYTAKRKASGKSKTVAQATSGSINVDKETKLEAGPTTTLTKPEVDALGLDISDFARAVQFLPEFESRINKSAANLITLTRAETQFVNLANLARQLRSTSKLPEDAIGFSASALLRIAELAENTADQIHAAAISIAQNANPAGQLNQVKRNLPILHDIIQQLLLKIQKG